jgi:hypothetical protein
MKVYYDDASVIDADGNSIGTVEETYIDANDIPRFVSVRTGTLFHKHYLVPLSGADMTDQGLQLPFTKDQIEGGPQVDPGDTLAGDVLGRTRAYYTGAGGMEDATDAADTADDGETDGDDDAGEVPRMEDIPLVAGADGRTAEEMRQVRDLGDVVEIPIVEERLVRQPVIREVVRVRRSSSTVRQTVGADVRREDVEVDDPDGVLAGKDASSSDS